MLIQVCRYPHEDVHAALFRKGKKGKRPGIGYHNCESLDDEISPEARQEVAGIVVDCAVVVEGMRGRWGERIMLMFLN